MSLLVLKPEAMQRAVIVASKGQQGPIVETLHAMRVAHFIEHTEKPGTEFAEFKLGAPMAAAGPASEKLVRVRAILRHLGLEGTFPSTPLRAADVERRVDADLDAVERDVNRAHESREALQHSLDEGRDVETKLQPLAGIPLKLEDYRGYDSLTTFVGRADETFEPAVHAAAPDALLVRSSDPKSGVFALFVPKDQARAASEALYKHGFAELEVPAGSGTPDERLREIQQERVALQKRAEQAKADLARLGAENKEFLLAAEEHLTIIVEKAEAPLSFASTENAFVVDAWVPASRWDALSNALNTATSGNVHIELVPEAAHDHGHDHAAHAEGEHHEEKVELPPTKYDNPKSIQSFQWFTDLFAVPRYDEIDPTLVLATIFPLFFGFMIGDLGLGILLIVSGWALRKFLPRVDGMKQLGMAFIVAGVIAALVGAFVFGDAFGIAFGATHSMNEELDAAGLAHTCPNLYDHVKEATWQCLFSPNGADASTWQPLIEKSGKDPAGIKIMLLLALVAGGLHLLFGMLLGIRNESGHGGKHLGAKVGYLVLLLGFYPAALALMNYLPSFITPTQAYLGAAAAFVLGVVILGWAEGLPGVFEIPTVFSNIFSYLRLGAVGIAKGAMAVAFNGLTLVAIGLSHHSEALFALYFVLGVIAFILVQAILFVLGVMSAGIQAIRLNFVEFFSKFYKGGGKPYKPFGRERVATTQTSPSTP